MNWGKIALTFQACTTLVLGLVFLSQSMLLDSQPQEIRQTETNQPLQGNVIQSIDSLKNRFSIATYILLITSILELIMIFKI